MAGLKFSRKTTDNLSIKGLLDPESETITYIDEDKNEQVVDVKNLVSQFAESMVTMTIKREEEEPLVISVDEHED